MAIRFLFLTLLLVLLTMLVVEYEREYRELQAIRVRQIYQKQYLLEDQSRLRLELQEVIARSAQAVHY